MEIKPISIEAMVERARQNYNNRHPFMKIPAPKTEAGQILAKKIENQILWENVIKRVARKMKWQKLV